MGNQWERFEDNDCLTLYALYYMLILYLFISYVMLLSHMFMHLHCTCTFFHMLSFHITSLHCVFFALINCLHVKGLLNKCLCQINPKVIQMKVSRKAGWSWVPTTFPRMYLSSEPSRMLILLCMDSKLVPGPKNQVATPFLCPRP